MRKTVSLLIIVVMILVSIGFVMLTSTSSVLGKADPYFYAKRQLIWLCLSVGVTLCAANIPYRFWRQVAIPMTALSIFLLILVLLPGIGHEAGGSNRWIRYGPVGFQPSELAKVAVVMLLAWYMSKVQRRPDELIRGLIIPLTALGTILLLVFVEPDFGTTFLIGLVGMSLMFIGGSRISFLVIAAFSGLTAFFVLILQSPERLRRVIAFTDPIKYRETDAYQLINALYSFVLSDGVKGAGLGNSIQKRFYLPEAHTDFIFAIIGEELGMIGSVLVVLLFAAFCILGWIISLNAGDVFGRLLGLGFTMMITTQAVINMCVVTGLLPTKGLALPFISFGGSSFVVNGLMLGILINIGLSERRDV